MPRRKKTKLKLNDIDSLTYLMQETYNDACNQQIDAQRAINEMVHAAQPEDVADITSIAREKANLLKIKDSAIKIKLELSKLKSEIIKQNGIPEESSTNTNSVTLEDFKTLRDKLKNWSDNDNEEYDV